MSNDIAKSEPAGVPAWAREKSTGVAIGNIDASDLKPPRLKVLAGQSPEVMDQMPGAVPGNFWMTVLNLNLGQSVTGTPILLRKSYQLWAPKMPGSEQKGPLATASDGIHWDIPNQTFEVKFPGNPKSYTWEIKRTVAENGMHKFGSSQDDVPSSKPAATLTYDVLWLIDLPGGRKQLCVFTNARTGVKPTQTFISTMQTMGVDHFYQRYKIVVQRKTGPTGDYYFTYDYQFVGTIKDEKDGDEARAIFAQYSKSGFLTDVEVDEDARTEARAPVPPRGPMTSKDIDGDEIPF